MMTLRRLFELLMVGFLAVGLTGCDVDVEDQGELPEVEVEPAKPPTWTFTVPKSTLMKRRKPSPCRTSISTPKRKK